MKVLAWGIAEQMHGLGNAGLLFVAIIRAWEAIHGFKYPRPYTQKLGGRGLGFNYGSWVLAAAIRCGVW